MSITKIEIADVQNENATDHSDSEQTTLTEQTLIQRMWNMIFGRHVSDCDNSKDDWYYEGYEDGLVQAVENIDDLLSVTDTDDLKDVSRFFSRLEAMFISWEFQCMARRTEKEKRRRA